MQIGMVGLGKMGGNMALRLIRSGHDVVGFDLNADSVKALVSSGLNGAASPAALCKHVVAPRHIWIMVPAGGPVDATVSALLPHLSEGDVLIDGGNSDYRNTLRRKDELAEDGIEYVDVGTSGGVWGLENGYSMMVGGSEDAVNRLQPALDSLAYNDGAGWERVGPTGAGHFVKMIHNGIEYGLMQAYAEGFAVMERKEEFEIDLHKVAEVWRQGSVIRSWLLDLTSEMLAEDPKLEEIAPYVPDSGEGRWTVREAIDLNVAAPVITTALLQRIQSRDEEAFAHRMLAGMRRMFGGHAVREASS